MELTDKFKLTCKFRNNRELMRALNYIESQSSERKGRKDEIYLVEVDYAAMFEPLRIVEVTVDFRLNTMYFKGTEIDVRALYTSCAYPPKEIDIGDLHYDSAYLPGGSEE